MKETWNQLQEWLNNLTDFSLPEWRNLPDLDLYMDQVITYLERELAPLVVENQEKMITSWMINNYVKGNLLDSPVQKKYTTEHLGYMFAICSVKQILSISDIAKLLNYQREETSNAEALYQFFRKAQAEMIHSIAKEANKEIEQYLEHYQGNDQKITSFLHNYVFKLAIEAEVKKIIANKILYLISVVEQEEKLEQEKIEKEKQTKEKEQKEAKEKQLKEQKDKEQKEKLAKEKEIKEIREKENKEKKELKNNSYLVDIPS